MVDRPSHRITEPLTEEGRRRYAESRARVEDVRRQVEVDLPELMAAARRAKSSHDAAQASVREVVGLLKSEREAQGISLDELQERTGLPRGELERLEAGEAIVVSLATLNLYAAALGRRLSVTLSGSA